MRTSNRDSFGLRYDQNNKQNNNKSSLSKLLFNFLADPCYNYHNLSDANRKSSYVTPLHGSVFCDYPLTERWYRFVGAAGTKMPTMHVPANRCRTNWLGWLDGAHPIVEDGEVSRTVCFYEDILPEKKISEN